MEFAVIAGHDLKWGIGKNGQIPWSRTPEGKADMNWFKEMTTMAENTVVIMGRKTYESIPPRFRPLADRINVVITAQNLRSDSHNLIYVKSFEDALKWCARDQPLGPVFVIGGQSVYKQAVAHPLCREVYLNKLPFDAQCDVVFPAHLLTASFEAKPWPNDSINATHYVAVNRGEVAYLDAMRHILKEGITIENRTGIPALTTDPKIIKIDLYEPGRGPLLPLLTTKRVPLKWIYHELMWFLSGASDVKYLKENGVTIWDANSSREFLDKRGLNHYKEGEVGPAYGYQWRHWGAKYGSGESGLDQIRRIIEGLKKEPYSRRHVLTAWNPAQIDETALPPCHVMLQLIARPGKNGEPTQLDGSLLMRSTDWFLGLPWNIAGYALLLHMIGKVTGMRPSALFVASNVPHIYVNHVDACMTQLERTPRRFPTVDLPEMKDITDLDYKDIRVNDYFPHPAIKAEMAV